MEEQIILQKLKIEDFNNTKKNEKQSNSYNIPKN